MNKRKLAVILFSLLGFVNSFAVDNSIYIDQTGSNSTVNINQDGAGNKVGGLGSGGPTDSNRAILYGNAQTVTVNQVGSNNTLQENLRTVATSGNGNNFNYSATGNSNQAVIDSNSAGASGASDSNNVGLTITGNSNVNKVNVVGTTNNITTNAKDFIL